MMNSTLKNNDLKINNSKNNNFKNKILPTLFWILVWQMLSLLVKSSILLPSPLSVLTNLINLVKEGATYITLSNSLAKVLQGFFIGALTGIMLSIVSKKYTYIYDLFKPLIDVIKITPIASFIILALAFIPSKNLSILIAFLMVMPIFYTNLFEAFKTVDIKMLEMAKIYKFSSIKKALYIYLPHIMPVLKSSIILGFSLGLKSAVATEVIAFANNSVGNMLLESKVTLDMSNLIAWTIMLIVFAIITEKLILVITRCIEKFLYKKGVTL